MAGATLRGGFASLTEPEPGSIWTALCYNFEKRYYNTSHYLWKKKKKQLLTKNLTGVWGCIKLCGVVKPTAEGA